jgi:hypothetical protein
LSHPYHSRAFFSFSFALLTLLPQGVVLIQKWFRFFLLAHRCVLCIYLSVLYKFLSFLNFCEVSTKPLLIPAWVFFISYHYVELDTQGGRSLDPWWFMVINFSWGQDPHVQLPTALLGQLWKWKLKDYPCSQAVTHPTTNTVKCCLTS